MRFKGLTNIKLYKTPLDSNYRNVFDEYRNSGEYEQFLGANFQYISINVETDKSRMDRNGSFSLILAGYTSQDLHDYNYMSFSETNEDIKFAFITAVNSKNDSSSNSTKSCELICKLDTFANHYIELQLSNVRGHIIHGTFEQNLHKALPNGAYLDKPRITQTCVKRLSSLQNTYNNNISVLWQRIYVNANSSTIVRIKQIEGVVTTDSGARTLIQGQPLCFYIPVGIVDGNQSYNLLRNCNITATRFDYTMLNPDTSVNPNYNKYFLHETVLGSGVSSVQDVDNHTWDHELKSDTILKSELTMWAPFRFHVEGNNPSYWVVVENSSVYIGLCGNFYGFIRDESISQSQTGVEYEIPVDLPTFLSEHRNNTTVESILSHEYSAFQYPYNYYRVLMRDKVIDIKPNELRVFIEVKSTSMNNILYRFVYRDTFYTSWEEWKPIISPGEFVTAYSQLEAYLRANGNRAVTQEAFAIANSVMKIPYSFMGRQSFRTIPGVYSRMAGIAGTSINALEGPAQYRATIDDYSNMLDSISIPSVDAIVNAELLDEIFITKCTADKISDYDYKNAIVNHHCFGVDIDTNENITSVHRDYFDIKQTSNLHITIPMNEEDRKELEEAYNRGITFWHISNRDATKTMNRMVTNYYISTL